MRLVAGRTAVGLVMIGLAAAASAGRAANHAPARPAAGEPGADAIIQKMAAHYLSLSSLRVNVALAVAVTISGKKNHADGGDKLAMQRPNMYACEEFVSLTGAARPFQAGLTSLGNDRETIVYNAFYKQYTRGPAASLATLADRYVSDKGSTWSPGAGLLLTLFNRSTNGEAVKRLIGAVHLVGRKALNGRKVAVLYGSPSYLRSAPGVKDVKCFLAVDVSSGILLRESLTARRSNASISMTEDIQPISENTPLPASLFTFQPPADVKLVDKFQAPSSGTSDNAPAKTAAAMVGKAAPDFSLQALNGKTIDLNSLKGRTILMDFSASW